MHVSGDRPVGGKFAFTAPLILLFTLLADAFAVKAFSEVETVSGTVVSYEITKLDVSRKTIRRHVLYIITLADLDRKPAFMKEGQRFLRVLSSKPVPPWIFSRRVKVRVRYSGDERGGYYWLISIREVD